MFDSINEIRGRALAMKELHLFKYEFVGIVSLLLEPLFHVSNVGGGLAQRVGCLEVHTALPSEPLSFHAKPNWVDGSLGQDPTTKDVTLFSIQT